MAKHYFPGTWDWAAVSLGMDVPAPPLAAPPTAPAMATDRTMVERQPPPPFFKKSTRNVSLRGEPLTQSVLEQQPASPIQMPTSARSVNTQMWSGKSQSPVKVPPPKKVESASPE